MRALQYLQDRNFPPTASAVGLNAMTISAPLTNAFVRDFHRRIPPADRPCIAVNGGLGDARHMIVSTATIAGAILES